METITLTLPLPPEVLHPNGRTKKHGYRAAMVRKTREESCWVARHRVLSTCPWDKASVQLVYYMPRRRDEDGLIAWAKSSQDGIADAGIIANDSGFTVLPPQQVTGKKAGRKLVVIITRL